MSSRRKNIGLDKFYTKDFVVDICLGTLQLEGFDEIIEPSAGNGSFSKRINCIALDISPELPGIIEADFLTMAFQTNPKTTLILGNPPFGSQSKLAFAFLKKAMSLADTVAFILPASFKKPSYQNRIPMTHTLGLEFDLPQNAFTENGRDFDHPCVWQIWKRGRELRQPERQKSTSPFFTFVKEARDANVVIRRVGAKAGQVVTTGLSAQSNYFVKCSPEVEAAFKRLSLARNTKNLESVSKPDIVRAIEQEMAR